MSHSSAKLSPWFIVLMLANFFALGSGMVWQRWLPPEPAEEVDIVITSTEARDPCSREKHSRLVDLGTGDVAAACKDWLLP